MRYGDWQSMPDYREGWVDKHRAGFGGLLRALDPMTYVPGISSIANAAHDIGGQAVTGINTALSPIVGGAQKLTQIITPGLKQVQNAVPILKNIDTFVRDKPFDAAALAAATFFSGGALSSSLASAGAPAASTAGGMGGLSSFNAAASSAITPAFQAGATGTSLGAGAAGSTTGALAGASSISPMLASGAYPGITGAAGTGTLGTVGTAAANGLITPGFGTLGGAGMGTGSNFYSRAKDINRYRSLNQPTQRDRTNNDPLGDSVLINETPKTRPLNVQRISRKLTGMR